MHVTLGYITDEGVSSEAKGNYTITKFTVWETVGQGDYKTTTYWKCTIFGKSGEVFAKHHGPGDPACVMGQAKVRKWEGKEGKSGMSAEIDVKDWRFVPQKREGSKSKVSRETSAKLAPEDTPF